ncbi:hypothetical protein ACWC5C_11210 [Streptomyces sp. NPDC001700]
MTAVIAAMITAVVGVLGTLFAPLPHQRLTVRQRAEEVRRDYRDRYAEAQMIVPERVLTASRDLNTVLAGIDAMAKRIDRGLPREGETAGVALLQLKDAEPRLSAMRRVMREDLGLTD